MHEAVVAELDPQDQGLLPRPAIPLQKERERERELEKIKGERERQTGRERANERGGER